MMFKKDFDELFKPKLILEKKCNHAKIISERLQLRMSINEKKDIILKLGMILGLKCLRGEIFLTAMLNRIKLIKEVFIHEIENGDEIFIPEDLSQERLPMSFRYYDSVISLI